MIGNVQAWTEAGKKQQWIHFPTRTPPSHRPHDRGNLQCSEKHGFRLHEQCDGYGKFHHKLLTKDSHGDSRLPSFMLSVDAVPDHAIVRKIEVYQFPCFCKLRYKQINVIGNLLNAKGNSTNYYST